MSCGYATPEITYVDPGVAYSSAGDAAGDAAEQVAEQLVDLVVPALLGLGALSGALLAGRAAMTGTRLLAEAAQRAAEAQRCRAADADRAARVREQWQDAAYAVCRANARLDALRARIAGPGRPGGPSGPSSPEPGPPPGLPPALDPVGLRLDQVHRWLAETDRAVRCVEAEQARRTMAAADAATRSAASGAAALRARRERTLAAYADARTEAAATAELTEYASPIPKAGALNPQRAQELGAEILAGLDTAVSVADCVRIQEQIGHAVDVAATRPKDASLHLAEARDRARTVNWQAADRRETAEWAAQCARFLRQPLPGETGPPRPETTADIAALERILAQGDPVDPRQRAEISARINARVAAIERLYKAELLRHHILAQAQAQTEAGQVSARQVSSGIEHIEWVPRGWGPEHWLRIAIDPKGPVRVQTVHRARAAHEDTRQARQLDQERCREAAGLLAHMTRDAAQAGLALDLVFDDTRIAVGEGSTRRPARPARDDTPASQHRTRDQNQ